MIIPTTLRTMSSQGDALSDDDHITPQEIAEFKDWQILQTY